MIDLSRYIDYTNLRPTATLQDILTLCQEASDHNFKAVCVAPYYLYQAKKVLDKSEVKLCTVVGFPFGHDHVATKMTAIAMACDYGADELDVVINLPSVKSGDWESVESEIDSITTAAKLKANKVLKLILETAYLTKEELITLCNLCIKYNVDFAKTSTGFAPHGATVQDVTFMRSILSDKVSIKASGGVKTREFTEQLIAAGATRIGTSSGIEILRQ